MMHYSKLVWITAVMALLSACKTVMDRRISAHEETWRSLSEQEQHRLLQGHVRPNDTEDMVSIALGPPDKVLPVTDREGQKQTVWIYDLLEYGSGYDPFDPKSLPNLVSSEKSVIFRDGVVVDQAAIAVESIANVVEFRAKHTAEFMEARLDLLVAFTSKQKVEARGIFENANEKLYAISPDERPARGFPIRAKMRADIRAILTAEQQAKYDATPQYLGGGSTKRQ
jgi:hypothetical protein